MPDIFLPEDLVELFKASYGLNLLITCVPDLLTQDPLLCGPPGSGSSIGRPKIKSKRHFYSFLEYFDLLPLKTTVCVYTFC
jgi:hypothetical protein